MKCHIYRHLYNMGYTVLICVLLGIIQWFQIKYEDWLLLTAPCIYHFLGRFDKKAISIDSRLFNLLIFFLINCYVWRHLYNLGYTVLIFIFLEINQWCQIKYEGWPLLTLSRLSFTNQKKAWKNLNYVSYTIKLLFILLQEPGLRLHWLSSV